MKIKYIIKNYDGEHESLAKGTHANIYSILIPVNEFVPVR